MKNIVLCFLIVIFGFVSQAFSQESSPLLNIGLLEDSLDYSTRSADNCAILGLACASAQATAAAICALNPISPTCIKAENDALKVCGILAICHGIMKISDETIRKKFESTSNF